MILLRLSSIYNYCIESYKHYRILILLSSFPATTLYNSNNVTHAINQNATEQIMITGLATTMTTTGMSISPQTNNNNNNAVINATTPTATIPTAQSVYESQSITLPPTVKSFCLVCSR
jgi:hypothetical protein